MTKEQERNELHKTIWNIANELRGSVDGWDFKQYVLGTLFYRFISENLADFINKDERRSNPQFDYSNLTDQEAEIARVETVNEKGFFILPSELFCNVVKNCQNNPNLNVTLHNAFKNIENSAVGYPSEQDLKGLFADIDVNSIKLGATVETRNKKLARLLQEVANLKLGNYQQNNIDVFGDAYEFLMQMYASQAGKSGGEFFTPQEVSELLVKLTLVNNPDAHRVYDPACGSGSLLLKFAKVMNGNKFQDLQFFGQEINPTTYNLCRINMFLHDVAYNHFNIQLGDTLTEPKHKDDEPFDAIVSNPPYSIKWEGDSNPILINDERFSPAGVLAPKSKADLAFTMHMLSWLSNKGTCAIVEFPGVLYRGGAEQKIRKYLIDNNFIDCVIQLPADLFFGVTIATCILVLKKNKTDNKVLFIDASDEFTRKDTKNKLEDGHINKIVNAFTKKETKTNFAYLAEYQEIVNNDYNISVNKYVQKETQKQEINITELNQQIKEIVAREQVLREEIDKIIANIEGV